MSKGDTGIDLRIEVKLVLPKRSWEKSVLTYSILLFQEEKVWKKDIWEGDSKDMCFKFFQLWIHTIKITQQINSFVTNILWTFYITYFVVNGHLDVGFLLVTLLWLHKRKNIKRYISIYKIVKPLTWPRYQNDGLNKEYSDF